MLSIEECRKELGDTAKSMADEQVKEVRDSLYGMAELALDVYIERCKMKAMKMDRSQLVTYLLEKLNLTQTEVDKHREFYNNHFTEYENDVYLDPKTRLVHLLNFFEENLWFNERFNLLFKHYDNYEALIDFGYGLPYLAITLAEKNDSNSLPKQIFVDKYQSAEDVSKEILSYLNLEATFITKGIESEEVFKDLRALNLPNKKLFVALETIEHLDNPEEFWSNLKDFQGSDFIVSLPVGPKIPSHTLFFNTVEEVREYLSKYLNIKDEHIAQPKGKDGRDLDQYKVFSCLGNIK